ncbi:unnamed protein product [Bemisia tabaci]|uniref:Uncharacterized protein n=1 Tax=Bemisia tabaci TaxID=7038 RepID=A0A9P0AMJ0_BEMTA|nr:unnamed protein product [Bemisia tabaci]
MPGRNCFTTSVSLATQSYFVCSWSRHSCETCNLVHAATFQNILPRPSCKEGEIPEVKLQKLEAKFDSLHVVEHVEELGSAKQTMIAKEGDF